MDVRSYRHPFHKRTNNHPCILCMCRRQEMATSLSQSLRVPQHHDATHLCKVSAWVVLCHHHARHHCLHGKALYPRHPRRQPTSAALSAMQIPWMGHRVCHQAVKRQPTRQLLLQLWPFCPLQEVAGVRAALGASTCRAHAKYGIRTSHLHRLEFNSTTRLLHALNLRSNARLLTWITHQATSSWRPQTHTFKTLYVHDARGCNPAYLYLVKGDAGQPLQAWQSSPTILQLCLRTQQQQTHLLIRLVRCTAVSGLLRTGRKDCVALWRLQFNKCSRQIQRNLVIQTRALRAQTVALLDSALEWSSSTEMML